MWDLSSLTRDQTHLPCFVRQCFNPWTAREVPYNLSLVHYIVKSLRAGPPLPCMEHQASGSGQKMLLHRPITLFVKVSLDDTFSDGTSHVFSCCKAPGSWQGSLCSHPTKCGIGSSVGHEAFPALHQGREDGRWAVLDSLVPARYTRPRVQRVRL